MRFLKVRKNTKRLLTACKELIIQYEGNTGSSCISDVLSDITEQLKDHKDEIVKWDDNFNYTLFAHILVSDTCYNLVGSGKYHIYTGVLNPMRCGRTMIDVYTKCLDYAIAIGKLTEEEKNENLNALREQISWVG